MAPLSIVSCSDDGDGVGDNGGNLTPAGAQFSGGVQEAAAVGSDVLAVFPPMTSGIVSMVTAADSGPPPAAKLGNTPIAHEGLDFNFGEIGLCSSGNSNLRWIDDDEDEELSTDDRLILTFDSCNLEQADAAGTSIANGSVRLFIDSVSETRVAAEVVLELFIELTSEGEVESDRIFGGFRLEATQMDEHNVEVVYRATEDGELLDLLFDDEGYDFGCFVVTVTLDLSSGTFTIASDGVLRSFENEVMSIFTIGPPWTLVEDEDRLLVPRSGAVSFLSIARVAPCAALGIGSGGVTPGGTFIQLTANGDGTVTLEHIEDGSQRMLRRRRMPWHEL